MQDKAVLYLIAQCFPQQRQMVRPFSEYQHLAALLIGGQHIPGNVSVACGIVSENTEDVLNR
jgi:hypothetical protein